MTNKSALWKTLFALFVSPAAIAIVIRFLAEVTMPTSAIDKYEGTADSISHLPYCPRVQKCKKTGKLHNWMKMVIICPKALDPTPANILRYNPFFTLMTCRLFWLLTAVNKSTRKWFCNTLHATLFSETLNNCPSAAKQLYIQSQSRQIYF